MTEAEIQEIVWVLQQMGFSRIRLSRTSNGEIELTLLLGTSR